MVIGASLAGAKADEGARARAVVVDARRLRRGLTALHRLGERFIRRFMLVADEDDAAVEAAMSSKIQAVAVAPITRAAQTAHVAPSGFIG